MLMQNIIWKPKHFFKKLTWKYPVLAERTIRANVKNDIEVVTFLISLWAVLLHTGFDLYPPKMVRRR